MNPLNPPRPRGKVRPRSARGPARVCLALEILEDRLIPSTTPTGPNTLSYDDWRNQRFSVEQQTVATAVTGPAGQGEGFGTLIGLDKVFANYSYRGTGYSVAVIDTGIDYNNPALGGGWGRRVIAGYDFANNDTDPMDDNGHGTHVAGIIGSGDATYTGIAPNINLIALKVLGADGSGSFGAVDQALQWVAAHQAQYNIVAINLSLGSGNYTINPYTYLESDFATLKGEGVFLSVAAGNSYYTYSSQQGLAYPAISPLTVSVGAVWNGDFGPVGWVSGARDNITAPDRITSFTQRSSGLDIIGAGALITSTYLNNTFKQLAGTSMAAPVVAASAALIHQALDARGQQANANQDYILGLMQSTGVTLNDGDDENDNVVNTGLNFKRLDLFAALSTIRPAGNNAPTIGFIADQSMTAGTPLTITIPAVDPDNDPLLFTGRVGAGTGGGSTPAYQIGQQLGLAYAGSYFLNIVGLNEKWVLGAGAQWYCLLPSGELRKWLGNPSDTMSAAALVTTLTPGVYADPTQFWTAPLAAAAPATTFAFAGNQLTLQVDPSYRGSFTFTVAVSDGSASAERTFTVNVNNRAPVLGAVAGYSINHAQKSLTINLTASDADNDTLTFSARALPPSRQLYDLEQSLGLVFTGNYWVNFSGLQEKWLRAGGGGAWYVLLPNGELRLGTGSIADILSSRALIATLDVSVYQDPNLLLRAQLPVTPSVAFAFSGNQMTITPAANVVGTFGVEVSAGDGRTTVKQTFTITISNSATTLAPIADQTMARGNALTVSLTAADADREPLTITGRVIAPTAQDISLTQSLGLSFAGNYWQNYWGQAEKWLRGKGGWYVILPSGELRRANGAQADALSPSGLVNTFDIGFYEEPSLLFNTAAYGAPGATFAASSNALTVTPAAGFVGSFVVEASATDGAVTARQTFIVSVNYVAPSLGVLQATQSPAPGAQSFTLPAVSGITYSARAVAFGQPAYDLDQRYGLYSSGDYLTNFWGLGEKWLKGTGGQWYCILPNGEVRLGKSTAAATLQSAALLGTLDVSFYANPGLLWNAQTSVAPNVSVTVQNNQLTVTPAAGYRGAFYVEVTASDGFGATKKNYLITV